MKNNGSRVVARAIEKGADRVFTVSFNNMSAGVRFVHESGVNQIKLIAAGERQGLENWERGADHAPEDWRVLELFGDFLRGGKDVDMGELYASVKKGMEGFYPAEHIIEKDLAIIFADFSEFDIVPECRMDDESGLIVVKAAG